MSHKTEQEILQESYLLMRGILSEEDNKIIDDILALDEISKATLGSYIKKASIDKQNKSDAGGHALNHDKDEVEADKHFGKANKRIKGIVKASNKLTKEQKEIIGSVLEELEVEEDLNEMLDYKTMSIETLRKHHEKHHAGLTNAKTQTKKLHHQNQLGIIRDVLKKKESN